MDDIKKIIEDLQNKMANYGSDLSDVAMLVNKINEIANNTIEKGTQKSFIDSLLSIPAFDEYDTVFSDFKETILKDRLNNTRVLRGKIVSLEKNAIKSLKASGIIDINLNKSLLAYFGRVNNIQSVKNLEKKNKERIKIDYEYESLMFDYKHYKELGVIDGLKEVQDIFGGRKIVQFEMPSKELVDKKNELDQKLTEFKRVRDLVVQSPDFSSSVKEFYPKTLSKLDEYIEMYENKLKIVNESLAETDYKEIKEAVENAKINAKKYEKPEDENKKNLLDQKIKELDDLKKSSNPNQTRIDALQKEISTLEKEEEEKTVEEMKDEKVLEEKVVFEKSKDEELLENAKFINLRKEAIKRLDEEDPSLKDKLTSTMYEEKISHYMQQIKEERIRERSIDDIEFELYKQDRTLTDEVIDEEFDKKSDKIQEYEKAAKMYIEKESELLDKQLSNETEFESMMHELENEQSLTDYDKMLEELDKMDILSTEEKEKLAEEIEARKLI